MAKKKLVMAWLKCAVDLAPMPEDETMEPDGGAWFSVGIIRNNTTQLTAEEGSALQAVESGGAVVAEERQEGGFSLSTEVIEPDDALYANLGLGDVAEEELEVKTHVAAGNYCMRLRPKSPGAKGVKAPKCSVSVSPAFGDDTGHALTLSIGILKGDAGYWYKKFLYRGNLPVDKARVELAATDSSASPSAVVTTDPLTDAAGGIVTDAEGSWVTDSAAADAPLRAKANASWLTATVEGKTVKIGAKANTGAARTGSVTITQGNRQALVTVTQAGGS